MWWCLLFLPIILFGLGRYAIWLPSRPKHWPRLIMLHQVDPSLPPSGMNMSPARFEQLLQLLQSRRYRLMTVSELVDAENQDNAVALTFDDGFADNYQYAFPLLKKYQAKATIYLATDIEGIKKLSEAQIQEMMASGLIEFGAHTLHHVNLTTLSTEDARRELEGSRQRVIELTGQCRSFAYPFGRFYAEHQKMAKQAGFDSAVSTRKQVEKVSVDNRFNLPRISTNGVMDGVQMRIALAKGRYRV
jgi:peptidoglycan/xylan/chitin deacetylase (PgdA/CDA1 family)